MTPLRERVVGALRLQPMSINQVARCLSVSAETARESLHRLERRGVVRVHGWVQAKRGKAMSFEVWQ
jgi:predicted ArsR family transcriptional regulator